MRTKKIVFSILTLCLFSCLVFGCKKKQVEFVEEVVEETTTETNVSDETTLESEEIIEATTSESEFEDLEAELAMSEDEELAMEEEEDLSAYLDLQFEESSGIFTVTELAESSEMTEDVISLYMDAKGSIAGMPGTYIVSIPFSLNWRRGDRAYVSYKSCYIDDEEYGESLVITDIIFVEKTDDKALSRQQQLKTERELQAKQESEAARQKAEVEESKRAAEQALAKQRAEVEAIRKQAALTYEAQQAAIVESIKAKEASNQLSGVIAPAN